MHHHKSSCVAFFVFFLCFCLLFGPFSLLRLPLPSFYLYILRQTKNAQRFMATWRCEANVLLPSLSLSSLLLRHSSTCPQSSPSCLLSHITKKSTYTCIWLLSRNNVPAYGFLCVRRRHEKLCFVSWTSSSTLLRSTKVNQQNTNFLKNEYNKLWKSDHCVFLCKE